MRVWLINAVCKFGGHYLKKNRIIFKSMLVESLRNTFSILTEWEGVKIFVSVAHIVGFYYFFRDSIWFLTQVCDCTRCHKIPTNGPQKGMSRASHFSNYINHDFGQLNGQAPGTNDSINIYQPMQTCQLLFCHSNLWSSQFCKWTLSHFNLDYILLRLLTWFKRPKGLTSQRTNGFKYACSDYFTFWWWKKGQTTISTRWLISSLEVRSLGCSLRSWALWHRINDTRSKFILPLGSTTLVPVGNPMEGKPHLIHSFLPVGQ